MIIYLHNVNISYIMLYLLEITAINIYLNVINWNLNCIFHGNVILAVVILNIYNTLEI